MHRTYGDDDVIRDLPGDVHVRGSGGDDGAMRLIGRAEALYIPVPYVYAADHPNEAAKLTWRFRAAAAGGGGASDGASGGASSAASPLGASCAASPLDGRLGGRLDGRLDDWLDEGNPMASALCSRS